MRSKRLVRQITDSRMAGVFALSLVMLGCSAPSGSEDAVSQSYQAFSSSGELKRYHKVTLDLVGPSTCEGDDATFTTNKLDVKFTSPTGKEIWVPGYFAADGDAIESGESCGNIWRAHLRPEELGTYDFTAHLVTGTDAHLKFPGDFTGLTPFSGGDFDASGEVSGTIGPITSSTLPAQDLRARGPVHKPENSAYTIQPGGYPYPILGAGSPEDFLGIADVDGNVGLPTCENNDCVGYTQDVFTNYAAHVADYDGTGAWGAGTKGQGTLGALDYLGSLGVTGLYIVINTAAHNGDATDTWIYAHTRSEVMNLTDFRNTYWKHIDVSKADQWARIFEEANEKGIVVQLYLHENENLQSDLDNIGDFSWSAEKRWGMLTRELMARFGYLNGLGLNLGEEVGYSGQTNFRMCDAIKKLDPYTAIGTPHLCLAHTHNNTASLEAKYSVPEKGDQIASLDGPALQGKPGYQATNCEWLWNNPPMTGKKYLCGVEEPNEAGTNAIPAAHVLMKGASTWLYYDGGSDNNISDFRNHGSKAALLRLGYMAQRVFIENELPVSQMAPDFTGAVFQGLDMSVAAGDAAEAVNSKGAGVYQNGVAYAAYMGDATSVTIDLPPETYKVRWYDDATQAAVQVDPSVTSTGEEHTFSAPAGKARMILVVRSGSAICTPSCSGRVCGDDGCGSSCGSCATTEVCTVSGICENDVAPPQTGYVLTLTYEGDSGGWDPAYPLSNLVDGDLASKVHYVGSDWAFVEYSLGETYTLTKARINADSGQLDQWKLEYWNGFAWQEVFGATPSTAAGWNEVDFGDVQADRIRVSFFGASDVEAFEFELYGYGPGGTADGEPDGYGGEMLDGGEMPNGSDLGDSADPKGCGCKTAPAAPGPYGFVGLGLVGLVIARRRRRVAAVSTLPGEGRRP